MCLNVLVIEIYSLKLKAFSNYIELKINLDFIQLFHEKSNTLHCISNLLFYSGAKYRLNERVQAGYLVEAKQIIS